MRIQAGIATPRPPTFHPCPANASRVGAALKFILVSNRAGHRMLLAVVSLNPSFFAAGDGQRRSCGCCSRWNSLGSGCWSWPNVDTASSPKNPRLSGWGGSAALNAVCSNCKHSESVFEGLCTQHSLVFNFRGFPSPRHKNILYHYSFRIFFPRCRHTFSPFLLSSGCAIAKAWSFRLCLHKEFRRGKEFHCCKTTRVKTPISFPAPTLDKRRIQSLATCKTLW